MQKPYRGTQLNRIHELAPRVLALVFNEQTGDTFWDYTCQHSGIDAPNDGLWRDGYELNGSTQFIRLQNQRSLTSFQDSGQDLPFSVFARVKMHDASLFTLAFKGTTLNANNEWRFATTGADLITIVAYDRSAGSYIGRSYSIALTSYQNTWIDLCATYDGSEGSGGFRLYLNGVRVDDGNVASGSYSGMEDLGDILRLGVAFYGGPTTYYADGEYDCFYIYDRELRASDVLSLHRDPYQIFEHEDFPGWLFVESGAAALYSGRGVGRGIMRGVYR